MTTRITQQTVALVQSRLGCTVDGIDGPQTQQAIKDYKGGRFRSWNELLNELCPGLTLDVYGDPYWATFLRVDGDRAICVEGVSGAFVPGGVLIHHTAGPLGRQELSEGLLIKGRAGLRGPLVQVGVSRTGKAHFVTNGRAHHAGAGNARVLDAVKDNRVVLDKEEEPGADNTYGNTHFLGIEIDNSGRGGDPYPAEQIARAVDIAASWCRAFGWGANRVIGHHEWTHRKSDPSYSITSFRQSVNAALNPQALRLEPQEQTLEHRIAQLEMRVRALEHG